MKRLLILAALAAAPVLAADLGVSISLGQPGFYGRLDIGDFPPPQVIYRKPMMVERVDMGRPPIYLRVPPGHQKNWRKHCGKYNACGEQVYFVKNDWYNNEYVPRYQQRHSERRDDRRDEQRNEHRGKHDNERRDEDRSHGRGR